MNCSDFRKQISAYLDGDTTKDETIKFKEHLFSCSECKKEMQSLEKCSDIMRTIYEEKEPPESIKAVLEQCCGVVLDTSEKAEKTHGGKDRSTLDDRHQKLFSQFYESTHKSKHIDEKTAVLVGLAAAMAINCYPCMNFYLKLAGKNKVTKGEIGDVLAKVMAVSAGQKLTQFEEALSKYNVDLPDAGCGCK